MVLAKGLFYWIYRLVNEYYYSLIVGIGRTVLLALVGTVVGLLLGFVFSFIITIKTKNKIVYVLKKLINIYVTVIRGTPMLVQATIFYYSISKLFTNSELFTDSGLFTKLGLGWTPLMAGLFTVSINTTAYLTEVLRGGINSVDNGQIEGARSIGLSNGKSFWYIILPQALKNSMASIGNEFIVNLKDTSVLSVIGVLELYNVSSMAGNKYCKIIEGMLIAALIYLILTTLSSFILKKIEKRIGVVPKEIVSCN